ncbi:uncharacterized protein PHACADRAFT_26993 [Phanerochaete carnosa HHB-10118-sp]|uniref:Uncharacterized protein n=1 Tax=Phanerochaete carnosa (strain HHB-10118-sp) TaxID=650164 RepID=K5W3R1_PHACS|nr:uncharacterized protein PHACADRAFT_26993 [Phanerochaete carnosa HHB-10118-sp]EKM58513.1 hypothetical protein PHACADRAFT_26993 [Phanerochaete carnosa HHB-10118-sp]
MWATAKIKEVEVDKEEGKEDATHCTKLWSGIVANQLATTASILPPGHLKLHSELGLGVENDKTKEGEVPLHVVEHAQVVALQLYLIIENHVAPAVPSSVFPSMPGTGPYLTLANVMARLLLLYQLPTPTVEQLDSAASTSLSWLSEEQTKLLEEVIAQVAAAGVALKEEGEDEDKMDTT